MARPDSRDVALRALGRDEVQHVVDTLGRRASHALTEYRRAESEYYRGIYTAMMAARDVLLRSAQ